MGSEVDHVRSYVITITPDSGDGAACATVTVRVYLASGHAQVSAVTLHAVPGARARLPDLGLLRAALTRSR